METRTEVYPDLCQEREREIRLFYIEAKMPMFRIQGLHQSISAFAQKSGSMEKHCNLIKTESPSILCKLSLGSPCQVKNPFQPRYWSKLRATGKACWDVEIAYQSKPYNKLQKQRWEQLCFMNYGDSSLPSPPAVLLKNDDVLVFRGEKEI